MSIYYDLETSISHRRAESLIIEIGACKGSDELKILVNPIPEDFDGTLAQFLRNSGAKVGPTMRWWVKLLNEKGFDICDIELENVVRGFSPVFEAVETFIEFCGSGRRLISHNGSRFDDLILRAHLERFGLSLDIQYCDSLFMLRRVIKLPSYKLGNVYYSIFQKRFKAHHALSDAKALRDIVEWLQRDRVDDVFFDNRLTNIPGVGKVTARRLKECGIETRSALMQYVKEHSSAECRQAFCHLYRYKKLGAYLYGERWCIRAVKK
jgi:DNA polymerase III epsilon subunit-like protein